MGRSIERSTKCIEDLERESLSAKETINKLHANLRKLDIHVIKAQEKIKDFESKKSLLEMHIGVHSESLNNFSQHLNMVEEALDHCGKGWDHYDRDQKWNIIMAHSMSQHTYVHCQHLHQLDLQLEDIKDTLSWEIHCFHCPHPDGVVFEDIECCLTGWGGRHFATGG